MSMARAITKKGASPVRKDSQAKTFCLPFFSLLFKDGWTPHARRLSNGASLVEVLVAAAIVVLVVLSLVSAFLLHLREGLFVAERVQATLLAEEGIEAIKLLRDSGWSDNIAPLSLGGAYHLVSVSGVWEATTTPYVILGRFSRTATMYPVLRDGNGDITDSGGVLDVGTRKVTVTVSWPSGGGTSTRAISTYLTNLFSD